MERSRWDFVMEQGKEVWQPLQKLLGRIWLKMLEVCCDLPGGSSPSWVDHHWKAALTAPQDSSALSPWEQVSTM